MTITILSITILGFPIRSEKSIYWAIPMRLYGDSQYVEILLLIGPFPRDLSVNIYNLICCTFFVNRCVMESAYSLRSVAVWVPLVCSFLLGSM
jgi:hypothetical protein